MIFLIVLLKQARHSGHDTLPSQVWKTTMADL